MNFCQTGVGLLPSLGWLGGSGTSYRANIINLKGLGIPISSNKIDCVQYFLMEIKKDNSYIRVRFVNVIMPLWIHVPATVIRVKGHLSASLHKWYQVCAIILSQFSPSLDKMVVKRRERCLIILNKDEYFVPQFIKLLKILKKC